MTVNLTPSRVRFALLALLGCAPTLVLFPHAPMAAAPDKLPVRTEQAWTINEALEQLALYPHDPYLQYVAWQLARRENVWQENVQKIQRLTPAVNPRESVDLFGIFTGALAVQESLQLDRMRVPPGQRGAVEPPRRELIDVETLQGPTIKSHPWEKMLGDKKPDISPLARMVPEDAFFIEFRSLSKMLDVLDAGDLWSLHLFNQASRHARTQQVGQTLRKQLVLETNRLLQPFYDSVVEEVAVTGSDLFFAEGSDVTMLFRAKQPDVLKNRMDGFLDAAAKARPDARRSEGKYLGVRYVHLSTPERDINVFSAYPEPGLHVRSNSKVGLRRVLEAIRGKTSDGQAVRRLGDSAEFAYIRTLMPRGVKEEDGFIYLSDPFIRHLVGPTLKLTERRRMLCYSHLRMIGHAALMYRTEHGRPPKSLEELERADCCPGSFNKDDLVCPDGGTYTLSTDGMHGVCSHHGHARHLVPCCETPLVWVYPDEAKEYERFRNEYNNYWRTYFDPIALRIQVTPQRYRVETIILPLINNSIYTGLARALGGKAEPLDSLPVPKRNIFSVAAHVNKETLLKDADLGQSLRGWLGLAQQTPLPFDVKELLARGLGDQISLHLCDSPLLFDLDMPRFFNLMFGNFNPNMQNLRNQDWLLTFLITSLNSPIYAALPVRNAKVVDDFLNGLDKLLSSQVREQTGLGWFSLDQDFYKNKLPGGVTARCHCLSLGPVKWRFHWARIGSGLYVASKANVLKDLAEAELARAENREPMTSEPDTIAHGLVRLRARNWNQVLPDYRLGWAENNRMACLRNLGPLASAGRAVMASVENKEEKNRPRLNEEMQRLADQMYAVHFFCPEGGQYVLAPDGRSCTCSVHGSAREPLQPLAANEQTGAGKLLNSFGGLSASLTFLEDGLHAVVILERQK